MLCPLPVSTSESVPQSVVFIHSYHLFPHRIHLSFKKRELLLVPFLQSGEIPGHILQDGICIHKVCPREYGFSETLKTAVDSDDLGITVRSRCGLSVCNSHHKGCCVSEKRLGMISYILGIIHTVWHASDGVQDHRVCRAIHSLHGEAEEARMFLPP